MRAFWIQSKSRAFFAETNRFLGHSRSQTQGKGILVRRESFPMRNGTCDFALGII
jgi:hypothetical protein